MRENGFDKVEVIAEMHKETSGHLYAGFDPELFKTGLYNPRRPPTPEEFTLDMTVEVESLWLELFLLQPLLQQLLPRQLLAQSPQQPCSISRMTTNTSKIKRGAQQPTVDAYLHVDCMRIPKRGRTYYLQADIEMNHETTTPQVAARQ